MVPDINVGLSHTLAPGHSHVCKPPHICPRICTREQTAHRDAHWDGNEDKGIEGFVNIYGC